MWKQIYEFAKDIVLLNREIQQNKEDIKEVRGEVRDLRAEIQQLREDFNKLIFVVQQLSFDIQEVSKRETNEREKIALQLENAMLKFERRLPQGKDLEK